MWKHLFTTRVQVKHQDKTKKQDLPIVNGHEMRMTMWKNGIKKHQSWMKTPPTTSGQKSSNTKQPMFDLRACELKLKDGKQYLNPKDLEMCSNVGTMKNISITFSQGSVTGPVTFKDDDGKRYELLYRDGILHGLQRVFTSYRGSEIVEFVGWFKQGHPVSYCIQFLWGGGAIMGELDTEWRIASSAVYIYPDWYTSLKGEWEKGLMMRAREGKVIKMNFVDRIPIFEVEITGHQIYSYDPPTSTR